MLIANRRGRLVLVDADRCVDVERTSVGLYSADPAAVFDRWAEFTEWAPTVDLDAGERFELDELGPPSPRPRQVFGIGTNFHGYLEQVGWPVPEVPLVFTKFASSLAGPSGAIELSGPRVDWEVEVVVVIGREGHRIPAARAWEYVAGVTAGQDVSDRDAQMRPANFPQFNLGKSHPGYSSIGPVLVTPDEFADVDDIALSCELNGDVVQSSSTADLIFSVPELVEHLSETVTLLPGDLIFTGTPAGVGSAMSPPRHLADGDEIASRVAGVGEMRHVFTDRVRTGVAS